MPWPGQAGCGEYFASTKALAQIREQAEGSLPMSDFCPTCRALAARQKLAATSNLEKE